MPHSLITHGWDTLACPTTGHCPTDVAHIVAGPFAGLAGVIGLGWLASILRADAFISPSGTGLIYVTGTSRISYGLARNRYFPSIFGRTSASGVPWVGVIFAFIVGLVFLLPFPSWHSLVNLITLASVMMYAGAPLSLGAFRGQVPDAPRPYAVPWGKVFAPLSFVIADLLIYWNGLEPFVKFAVVLLIGYALIGISMAFDKQRPPLDWKNAVWLPVWLIGMGIICWQGQYGGGAVAPPANTNHIPLYWDILVVAGFSLVIYYWAMAVKLPRQQMLELVERQSGEQELPDTGLHH